MRVPIGRMTFDTPPHSLCRLLCHQVGTGRALPANQGHLHKPWPETKFKQNISDLAVVSPVPATGHQHSLHLGTPFTSFTSSSPRPAMSASFTSLYPCGGFTTMTGRSLSRIAFGNRSPPMSLSLNTTTRLNPSKRRQCLRLFQELVPDGTDTAGMPSSPREIASISPSVMAITSPSVRSALVLNNLFCSPAGPSYLRSEVSGGSSRNLMPTTWPEAQRLGMARRPTNRSNPGTVLSAT